MISAGANPTSRGPRGSKWPRRLHSWGGGFRIVCRISQGNECQAPLKAGPKPAGLGAFTERGTAELVAEAEAGDVQVQILLPVLMQIF